ncbi:thiamine pyrophosphate-dependent enzyme [Actinoplanes sp. NPDC000266]
MADRSVIAGEAVRAADLLGWPLFVGNGFLCREVMALAAPGQRPVLPLQGGMGLATGVAAGYALADRNQGAVVLEGDGNHAMGWGCAQLVGALGVPVLHLVGCNGVFRSTGGQQVPHAPSLDLLGAAAATLRYRHNVPVSTDDDLARLVDRLPSIDLPCLVYIAEDTNGQAPPRRDLPSAAYAEHLLSGGIRHPAEGKPC